MDENVTVAGSHPRTTELQVNQGAQVTQRGRILDASKPFEREELKRSE
jgi:hypothetical protein